MNKAIVILLRGVNVGGHKTFSPSHLAKKMSRFQLVNIGAAGTFVVLKPRPKFKFYSTLLQNLPFKTDIISFNHKEFLSLEKNHPFKLKQKNKDIVRFVSFKLKISRIKISTPLQFPSNGKWYVRILAIKKKFIFGEYRRHMQTISYLGGLDKTLDTPVTTRNWNTVLKVIETLKVHASKNSSFG